jgi:S-adenosylmethionine hydrolase
VATFSDVPPGACGAIVDSQGYVAIVVNRGSAASLLGLSVGDSIVLGA